MQVKLRLLPTEQLHAHEETIPQYLKQLTEQISSDTVVKHPLIVEDKTFIILDGMHRFAALSDLGCHLIPVALVDYENPRITVERWIRLVNAGDKLHLLFDALTPALQIHSISLREVGSDSFAESLMDEDHLAFSKLSLKGRTYIVEGEPSSVLEAYELVRELQEAFEKEDFKVSLRTEAEAQKLLEEDGKHCSLAGPRIKKADVTKIVSEGKIFPPKVTRHVLPLRVFNIDVPLERLKSKDNTDTTNQAFIEMLKQREQKLLPGGQEFEGRFYEEELIVFR
jgi:L-serine kinase (ADP)